MKFKLLVALLPLLAGCATSTISYFPEKGAKGVNPDTHLVLTFDQTPVIGSTGFIRIWDAATG